MQVSPSDISLCRPHQTAGKWWVQPLQCWSNSALTRHWHHWPHVQALTHVLPGSLRAGLHMSRPGRAKLHSLPPRDSDIRPKSGLWDCLGHVITRRNDTITEPNTKHLSKHKENVPYGRVKHLSRHQMHWLLKAHHAGGSLPAYIFKARECMALTP